MVRKGLLCLIGILVGVTYSYPVGSSTRRDATGPNHTYHMKHWENHWPGYISIVYHSQSAGFQGHYVLYASNGDVIIGDYIFDSGESNVAYPSIALSPLYYGYRIEAISYLSGTVFLQEEEIPPHTVQFPVGTEVKVAVHNPVAGGVSGGWSYRTVYDAASSPYEYLGVPHIAYAYQVDHTSYTEIHYIITFVAYYDFGGDHDIHLYDVEVDVDRSENLSVQVSQLFQPTGGAYPINPSTAASFEYNEDTHQLDRAYLHIVWKWPINNFNHPGAIGYRVMRYLNGSWTRLGDAILEQDTRSALYHFTPHINLDRPDRVFLTWRREEFFPSQLGQIVRRRKRAEYWDLPLTENWEPDLNDDPEPITQYDSQNYDSRDPQGFGTLVVWMEEEHTGPSDWQIWLREHDPDHPFFEYYDVVGDESSVLDTLPNVDLQIWEEGFQLVPFYRVLWTHGASSPYTIECIMVTPSYPWARAMGSNLLRIIGPEVPIFILINCGDSLPSPYCIQRDTFGNINGYPVDIGHQELIYRIPYLEPSMHYLIRPVVIAPDTIIETFGFDSIDIPVTVTPQLDSFDFILPDSIFRDRYVGLRISGKNGAYVSNIKVYEYEVPEDSSTCPRQSYMGITSLNPSVLKPKLSITPTLFNSATNIKYQVAEEGPVSLEVYNASGRLVEVLTRTQNQESGAYSVSWDGKDKKGRRMPAGIYFFKLRTGSQTIIEKALLIR